MTSPPAESSDGCGGGVGGGGGVAGGGGRGLRYDLPSPVSATVQAFSGTMWGVGTLGGGEAAAAASPTPTPAAAAAAGGGENTRLPPGAGGTAAFFASGQCTDGGVGVATTGRGLHSPTFQLNLSALYGIGGARRGCVAHAQGVLRGV